MIDRASTFQVTCLGIGESPVAYSTRQRTFAKRRSAFVAESSIQLVALDSATCTSSSLRVRQFRRRTAKLTVCNLLLTRSRLRNERKLRLLRAITLYRIRGYNVRLPRFEV